MSETKKVMKTIYSEFVAPIKEEILNEKKNMVDNQVSLVLEKKEKKTVFITYHPSDENLFQEVKGEVLKNKMEVVTNLDFQTKSGNYFFSTNVSFLNSIDCVIVLLNRNYCSNEDNKNEFITSHALRKKIIPIFTEKDFTGQGFDYIKLGISGSLFYSINDEKTKKEVMENVIKKELT